MYSKNRLCDKNWSSFCLVVFLNESSNEGIFEILEPIASFYQDDPISFVYVKIEEELMVYE